MKVFTSPSLRIRDHKFRGLDQRWNKMNMLPELSRVGRTKKEVSCNSVSVINVF